MDEQQRALCAGLRSMDEAQAAAWLREHYPATDPDLASQALLLLPHRPWKKHRRNALLDEYFVILENRPLGNSAIIKAATLMMPAWQLCRLLIRHLPTDKSLLDLFAYQALPILKQHSQTDRDREALMLLVLEVRNKA